MIQESEEEIRSRVLGELDSSSFGIEEKNLGMAYQAFIQYSNPIGSIVREITSNAWDATVDAGNNNPVVIEMSQAYPPDDERWIAFKDSGTGLVPLPRHTPDGRKAKEMFKEGNISESKLKSIWNTIEKKIKEEGVPSMLVYKNFFSSTKRDIIDQLGYFGLGAKSPLGYTDMFEIITRRSGWKYHYTVRKGEERPQLDLINCKETDRENGTTVRVPIASYEDWNQFVDSIHTQLAYFDNVVFEGGLDGEDVSNDFTIYRGDHFIYRPDAPFDTMHLCLGTVYYPLNFGVMDIREGYYSSYRDERSGHHIPIGLYFPLEDQKKMPIKVVWNRESIEYNDKTKESIDKKLKKAKEELQELYNEQYNSVSSVKEWYEINATENEKCIVVDNDVEIPVTDTIVDEPNIIPPGFENFFDKTPGNPFYMLKFHRKVEEGYINQDQNDINIKNLFTNPDNYPPVYITDKEFSTKKNKWISFKVEPDDSKNFIILRVKDMPSNIGDPDQYDNIVTRFNSYYREGDMSIVPSRRKLKAMLEFETQAAKYFRDKFRDYDSVTVSDSFKPNQHGKDKKKNRYVNYDPDKKFPLKKASPPDGYNDSYSWSRIRWKYDYLRTLDKRGTLVIYGYRENDDRLKKLMRIFNNISRYTGRYRGDFHDNRLHLVKIAKNRQDMFEDLSGSYHVDKFWESDHRIFSKIVTAFKVKDSLPDKSLVRKWGKYLPEAKKLYEELYELKSTYSFGYNSIHNSWISSLLKNKEHLVDKDVLRKVEKIQGYILKYPLLTWLERGTPGLNGLGEEVDLDEEVEEYIEDRPPIDPHLLYRYKRQQNQQDNGT